MVGGRVCRKRKAGPRQEYVWRGIDSRRHVALWSSSARQGSTRTTPTHPLLLLVVALLPLVSFVWRPDIAALFQPWHRAQPEARAPRSKGDDSTPEATAWVSQEREDILYCCHAPYARPVTYTHAHTPTQATHTTRTSRRVGRCWSARTGGRPGSQASLPPASSPAQDLAFAAHALSFCDRVAPAL